MFDLGFHLEIKTLLWIGLEQGLGLELGLFLVNFMVWVSLVLG